VTVPHFELNRGSVHAECFGEFEEVDELKRYGG
jgi:hypothetical protein